MLTNAQIKHLQNLKLKKYRQNYTEFMIEGDKLITEAIVEKVDMQFIAANKSWLDLHKNKIPSHIRTEVISEKELQKISSLKTPQEVVALINMPNFTLSEATETKRWILVLDGIRDPGNLGSLIRSADWFGLETIICSPDCVDLYNPKVIQATMGSIFRVKVFYEDIISILHTLKCRKFAATLSGMSIFSVDFEKWGVLVIGNESNGIRQEVLSECTDQISIPAYGKAESLNAAVAASIILSRIAQP